MLPILERTSSIYRTNPHRVLSTRSFSNTYVISGISPHGGRYVTTPRFQEQTLLMCYLTLLAPGTTQKHADSGAGGAWQHKEVQQYPVVEKENGLRQCVHNLT